MMTVIVTLRKNCISGQVSMHTTDYYRRVTVQSVITSPVPTQLTGTKLESLAGLATSKKLKSVGQDSKVTWYISI